MIVLDTDVASHVFKNTLPSKLSTRLIGKIPFLTFVTVGELTKWVEIRSWGHSRRERLGRWVANHGVLEYDVKVARTWGELAAAAALRGRPRPANDMWIAACCLVEGLPLATLNTKDFEDFHEFHDLVLLS